MANRFSEVSFHNFRALKVHENFKGLRKGLHILRPVSMASGEVIDFYSS